MDCPTCWSDETYETTTLGQRWRTYLCCNGHGFTDVEERPHRYRPPLQYLLPAMPEEVAGWVTEAPRWVNGLPLSVMERRMGHIFCGPPAPLPAVPTPQDILIGAGILDPADAEDDDPIPRPWSMLIP
jgi:hypothetical protein